MTRSDHHYRAPEEMHQKLKQRFAHFEGRKKRFLWLFLAFFTAPLLLILILVPVIVMIFRQQPVLLRGILASSWFVFLGIGLFFTIGIFVLAVAVFRAARPISDIISGVDSVAGGNLDIRASEHYPGEFGRLARSFNKMVLELKRAEQQRKNLTADIVHELRTPLQILQGNIEGIMDGIYQPDAQVVRDMFEETQRLAHIVDDLQVLTLAENQLLPLNRQEVIVNDCLEDLITNFSVLAEKADVSLSLIHAFPDEKRVIIADPVRLDQILGNLLSNALRHTPAGKSIEIRDEWHEGGMSFLVKDSGEGIAPEELPFIFERFWRGDKARSHDHGAGSGLGLAICKQLVELQGGKIYATSKQGEGTLFEVKFPLF